MTAGRMHGTRHGPGLIAERRTLTRAGLQALLEAEPDIVVAASAASGEEAVALAREIRPDVLLAAIALPDIDGVELTRRIVADATTYGIGVLLVGASEDDERVVPSLRAGARGFLLRATPAAALSQHLRTVAAGEPTLSGSVVSRLIAELASRPDPRLPCAGQLDELTAREREVMTLVAMGFSNDQIAEELVVSRATAKTHVSRVLRKLGARDRAQLVALAYESGLVRPRLHAVA